MKGKKEKTATAHMTTAARYVTPSAGVAVLATTVIINRLSWLFADENEKQLASIVVMGLLTIGANLALVFYKKKVEPILRK